MVTTTAKNGKVTATTTMMMVVVAAATAATLGLGWWSSSLFLPLQAFAASPANDDFDSATSIGSAATALPFADTSDTSEATTAADDPDCNGNGATVWYSFTPAENMYIGADTFGSDYDTTLSVYTGSRGALSQIACNDDYEGLQSKVRFDAITGQTYYLMIASFAGGPGGNLVFSVDVLPPPLTFDLTVDSVGKVDAKTGIATISGTFACSREAPGFFSVSLEQTIGRFKGSGSQFADFTCTNGMTKWSAEIQGDVLYVGGRANVSVFAIAFDEIHGEIVLDEASRTVRLMGGPR